MTTPYTPESNGLAERAHQTLLGSGRPYLLQARIAWKIWNLTLQHVFDYCNVVENSATNSVHHEKLFGMKPWNLPHLRLFGCHVLYHLLGLKLQTLKERARDGLFLYQESCDVYLVLDDYR